MHKNNNLLFASTVILSLALTGCDWLHKSSGRETVLDRIVSIPKELVLDIPNLPPLCDKIKDLKTGFVDVENGKLYYEEEGQGMPLVLINGGPGGTHHDFHPWFSCVKDFYKVIYYDQRGTGKSSTDETGKTYSVRQAVEDLENLRKELNIDQWAILGWSYGGFLAQCYSLTYPSHVKALVLVAASDGLKTVRAKCGRSNSFISKKENEAINKIYKAVDKGKIDLVQMLYNKNLCGDWKRQHYYKPTNDEMIRAARYEWSPAPGFRNLIGRDEYQIGLDGKFDDFEIPTLIFEGKWDLTWDTDKAELMRKNHPHAQVEVLEKSGHLIFGDEPEKFFAILRKFVDTAINTQIKYKPGNRLTWPRPLAEFDSKITMIMAKLWQNKQEAEKQILALFDQAVSEKIKDSGAWESLFHYLFGPKKTSVLYEKALYALEQYERTAPKSNPEQLKEYRHCIKVWKAQVLDLLGRREEAIKYYQDVLNNFTEKCESCSQADRNWLEERLKTPFKWK